MGWAKWVEGERMMRPGGERHIMRASGTERGQKNESVSNESYLEQWMETEPGNGRDT